jgi:hypothetical protein
MDESIFMKLGAYMTPELISAAYFINSSHQSMCLHMYTSIFASQRLSKNIPVVTNAQAIEELLGASFSERSMSYQWKVGD